MENYLIRNEFKVLLGDTTDNSLVFANIHLPKGNRNYFSVSFDEVIPFEASYDYLREILSGKIDSYDKEDKYDLCEEYNCTPNDLEDTMFFEIMDRGEGIEGIIDISLYSESFSIEGLDDDIYFESESCGQHDTRNRLNPIDKEFSTWLHSNWDKLHLKELTDRQIKDFEAKIRSYEHRLEDEDNWIKNWLEELYQ